MSLLDLDARWRRFNDPDRACPCCGRRFSGIFDLGFEAPDAWPHGPREDDELRVGEDRLTPELCRLDAQYFLRGVLHVPVRGADDALAFGPWAEVPRELLHAYLDSFEGAGFAGGEGLLANALPGFEESEGTPVTLAATDSQERPALAAQDGPLAEAQAGGISFDALLDLYAAAGHDIRPHLAQD
ncbi:DUF2199 domain-containing protein [Salipiger mucosus]|uniref:Uncharacterized protein n=1 Tax=Salipiger mucosus DSM 16094 TaxID=1123237 RepID=S9QQG2_9RHOB|nr:DUF2199 domain-containing protein [Salipiger mucosus]EPX81892.1 hypothetical protein Salmuc_00206 [Salipiger mucosus DSM 16094]